MKNQLSRRSLLNSSLMALAVLIVFVGLAYSIDLIVHPSFSSTGLLLTGIVMAVIPALVWIGFFYQQDQREPEPKSMVFQVFILGGLLATSIGIPLIEDFFRVSDWIYTDIWVNLLGAILIIGFTQEFLKYAAVRFSVYSTSEFDERTDGIIYATAAGLGFATVLNIFYIINSGGVNLGIGAVRITLTALAQASFAGITGYFLSREKLDHCPAWWVPIGVGLASILNGLFFTFYGSLSKATITSSGAYVRPWIGFVMVLAITLGITGMLTYLIQRDQNRIPRKEG